jgi:DNA integrity scanning protein DisA with diadenylate cyclase activity
MLPAKDQKNFFAFVDAALKLAKATESEAMLILLERQLNWDRLRKKGSKLDVLVVATHSEQVHQSATEADVKSVLLESPIIDPRDQLAQAVLASVAEAHMKSGSKLVALYNSGGDAEGGDVIDTITAFSLTEKLGRLTARDLRQLKTTVPLETLKVVVDLAVAIGREGREGKPIGTMFVVGDHRKVLEQSRPGGYDSVKGYPRKDRSLHDRKNREGIKEVAQLDGMFVVSSDGTVEASARIIDTPSVEITMTKGLGSRHFAGAAISKNTKAIAVVVSQSSGTVRIFQDGEVVLRIEPLQRTAMKWKQPVQTSQTVAQPTPAETPPEV